MGKELEQILDNDFLYTIDIPNVEEGITERVIFKPLPWRSYKRTRDIIIKFPEMLSELEEQVYDHCIIISSIPDKKLEEDGGLITTIFTIIMMASGASSAPAFFNSLEQARYKVRGNIDDQVQLLIMSVFSLTPEQINKMVWPEIVTYLAMTEMIMGNEMPAIPLRDEEEIAKEDAPKKTFEWQSDQMMAGAHDKQPSR